MKITPPRAVPARNATCFSALGAVFLLTLVFGTGDPVAGQAPPSAPDLVVEIRSYELRAGSRPEFHRLVTEEVLPMLERWEVDVVAYGPSLHNQEGYFLMRAYADLTDRECGQDAFYGSGEWRDGPRSAVLELIEGYSTVVLRMSATAVAALREGLDR